MRNLLRLLRPQQWIKNGFVLIPLFFGGKLFSPSASLSGIIAFFAFSFAASAIYCFNDIIDVEADRRHPVKRSRPIASGAVSLSWAYALMGWMVVLSVLLVTLLPIGRMQAGIVIAFYSTWRIAPDSSVMPLSMYVW